MSSTKIMVIWRTVKMSDPSSKIVKGRDKPLHKQMPQYYPQVMIMSLGLISHPCACKRKLVEIPKMMDVNRPKKVAVIFYSCNTVGK